MIVKALVLFPQFGVILAHLFCHGHLFVLHLFEALQFLLILCMLLVLTLLQIADLLFLLFNDLAQVDYLIILFIAATSNLLKSSSAINARVCGSREPTETAILRNRPSLLLLLIATLPSILLGGRVEGNLLQLFFKAVYGVIISLRFLLHDVAHSLFLNAR